MTRECGHGALWDNYIRITDVKISVGEDSKPCLDISIKAYLTEAARDFEKLRDYIKSRKVKLEVTTQAQANYLDTVWNKPEVLDVGTMVMSLPVKWEDCANKSLEHIYNLAYNIVVANRGALGYKEYNPTNVVTNQIETQKQFIDRVVRPFYLKLKELGETE